MQKICSKCKTEKSENEFSFRNKNKGIRKGTCKFCCKDWQERKIPCSCGELKHPRAELCQKCRVLKKQGEVQYTSATLGSKTYTKHKYAKYSYIRYYARKIGIENGFTCCKICGYSKHFEVAHIKPVSEYSEDTLLTTINDISNLVPLCPNCHWEFDRGLLKI